MNLRFFLYVEDFGPSQPVLSSGGLGTQFVWDPTLAKHVHRFKDLADFQKRARDIIHQERVWKILPGIELEPETPVAKLTVAELEAAQEEIGLQHQAIVAIAEDRLSGPLEQNFADFIRDCPAVKEIIALRERYIAIRLELDSRADSRKERDRILIIGDGPLPLELIAEYARLIGEKSGKPVIVADASARLIHDHESHDFTEGIGFQVTIGDRTARQAVYLRPDLQRTEILQALAGYFRKPDLRLVVDDENLVGHTLPLWINPDGTVSIATIEQQQELHAAFTATPPPADETTPQSKAPFEVDPQGSNPPPDPAPGAQTPDPLPPIDPQASPAEAAAANSTGSTGVPPGTSETPAPAPAATMTASEAGATLGNHIAEPADKEAAQTLSAAKKSKKSGQPPKS